MSHEKHGARTIRVTDRHGDSASFEVSPHNRYVYVTAGPTCVVLDEDDLRAMLEHLRDCLIQ